MGITGFVQIFGSKNPKFFPDFPKQYFIFARSRLPRRLSIETLKNAGTKFFYDALQTYGNQGAMQTKESFEALNWQRNSLIKQLL